MRNGFSKWGARYRRGPLCAAVVVTLVRATLGEDSFRDEFDGPVLESGWTLIHENPSNYSLTDRPGFFRVITERGTLSETSFVRNMLLREATGDFIMQTRLEFDPRNGQPFAGLLIFESDDNAAAFGLIFVSGIRGSFRGLALVTMQQAAAGQRPPVSRYDESTTDSPTKVHLRLLRSGNRLVAGFSEDGVVFTDLATVTNEFPQTVLVGVGGSSGDTLTCGLACDLPRNADFDFFSLTSLEAGSGGAGGDGGDATNAVTLSSVSIEGPQTVYSGRTSRFTAVATFSDQSTSDVTGLAEWFVAPPNLATVERGLVNVAEVNEPGRLTVVVGYTHLSSSGATSTASDAIVVDLSTASPPLCGAGAVTLLWLGLAPLGIRMRPRRS